SDKVNCVIHRIMSCEIRQSDHPHILSNDISLHGSDPVNISVYSVHTLPYILAMIHNRPECIYIDTGSTLSLCDSSAYPDEHVSPVAGLELTSASGHTIPLEGKITLELLVGN